MGFLSQTRNPGICDANSFPTREEERDCPDGEMRRWHKVAALRLFPGNCRCQRQAEVGDTPTGGSDALQLCQFLQVVQSADGLGQLRRGTRTKSKIERLEQDKSPLFGTGLFLNLLEELRFPHLLSPNELDHVHGWIYQFTKDG